MIEFPKDTLVVAATIEYAKYGDGIGGLIDLNGDDGPALVVRDAQPRTDIVASCTPVRQRCKALTIRNDRVGVTRCNHGRAVFGDVLVERN